ncbi:MAG: hypothetical protein WCT01_04020 [Candidatus Shapirobacteria bacterium]
MSSDINRLMANWKEEWGKVVKGKINKKTNEKLDSLNYQINEQWKKLGWDIPKGVVERESTNEWRGRRETVSLIPITKQDGEIASLMRAVEVALAPGKKVIIVKNRAQMTAVALLTNLYLFKTLRERYQRVVKGTATGATTMSLRMLWGLLPNLLKSEKEALKLIKTIGIDSMELKRILKMISKVVTLDDYGWTKESLEADRQLIGWEKRIPYTYREEQWTMWKYLLKNRKKLISPMSLKKSTKEILEGFRNKTNKLIVAAQDWGVGSDGHGGFNEPGYDPFSPDQVVTLNDLTLIQNITGFLRPEERRVSMIFRNLAAEKQIYDLKKLKTEFEKELKSKVPSDYLGVTQLQWEEIKKHYLEEWGYLNKIIKRIPRTAITQGVGDSIGRVIFHQFMADKPHKARAVERVLEGKIGKEAPATGLRMAPRVVFLVTQNSAHYLKNTNNYFYLKLEEEETKLFEDKVIYEEYVRRGKANGKNNWQIAAELNEPI